MPLRSATIQTLALALHELATNAVKYGALARLGSHLDVRWEIRDQAPNDRRLLVDWRERGVTGMPEAGASPRSSGYGRELIERALPYQLGAHTTYEFMSDGVHCTIDVSVPPSDHYDQWTLPDRFAAYPRLEKPFRADKLATNLPRLISRSLSP